MSVIKRQRRDKFAIIPNAVADDERLSFEARGMLVYLLAKPNDWTVSRPQLERVGRIGRDKTLNIIRELIEAGYIERRAIRSSGQFTAWEYVVYDDPCPGELPLTMPMDSEPLTDFQDVESPLTDLPDTAQPLPAKPDAVEPDTVNQDAYKEQSSTNNTPLPPNWDGNAAFNKMAADFQKAAPDYWNHSTKEHKAWKIFDRLSVHEQMLAVQHAWKWRWMRIGRDEPRGLVPYLQSRGFNLFTHDLEVDPDGYFVIHAKHPLWPAWLDQIERRYGRDARKRTEERGIFLSLTPVPESTVTETETV